jgi:flavin-dependent dehydrogenase
MAVTLLEASRGPRFRPGETLHPGVEPLLEQLEARGSILDAAYLRHTGTWVQWGGALEFVPFGRDDDGPWRGFQARRADFDQRLLNTARALGVQVMERTPAKAIVMRRSRVAGVATGHSVVSADYVIDATGTTRWLARQLGIPVTRHSPPLTARYGYVSGPRADRLPLIQAHADSWTWTADIGHGELAWVHVTTRDRARPANWLPDALRGARSSLSGGADVTWRMPARTAGDGWFMCGDGALLLDPSSSHGVLRGLMSGIAAARGAVEACAGLAPARRVSRDYHAWLSDWFRHDARVMAGHYHSVRLFGY